ncbi:MAG: UbiA family prenyltransferase [Phycisphaerae bacterium]|nr:UbiA family prenyltransferase [Phycisphaerae bacterium]
MPRPLDLLRLARPKQWAKSAFVMLGPFYGLRDHPDLGHKPLLAGLIAAAAFALASSACYIVNDIVDAESDRHHPRKCKRPIASGAVGLGAAWVLAAALTLGAAGLVWFLEPAVRTPTLIFLGLYIANVWAYSLFLKHHVILDVLSLSLGFVLRVLGGCAAAAVEPSTWLLNVTLFLAMFLAFGKRLGERRTMGEKAGAGRSVQLVYTDDLLRMFVVVTAVATLITYAGYVQSRDGFITAPVGGVRVLWFTLLPAMFAMLRSIVLLEKGSHDDPTEMAGKDWPIQAAAAVFVGLSAWAVLG